MLRVNNYFVWYPISTYVQLSEKLTFYIPLIGTRTCAYHGVKNVSFSENFAYIHMSWPKM